MDVSFSIFKGGTFSQVSVNTMSNSQIHGNSRVLVHSNMSRLSPFVNKNCYTTSFPLTVLSGVSGVCVYRVWKWGGHQVDINWFTYLDLCSYCIEFWKVQAITQELSHWHMYSLYIFIIIIVQMIVFKSQSSRANFSMWGTKLKTSYQCLIIRLLGWTAIKVQYEIPRMCSGTQFAANIS